MHLRQPLLACIVYTSLSLCVFDKAVAQIPSITAQPPSRTVQLGQQTVTSVTATGGAPISYQWYKNGGIVADATNSSYNWSNPRFTDVGTYYAVASNISGSTQSSNMTLTITCPEGGANDFQFIGGVTPTSDLWIHTTAVTADGKIYIGGDFTKFNGISINRLTRLRADGTLDPTFTNGSGANGAVLCFTVQPDGKMLLGGYFTSINGTTENVFARLNVNGTVDTNFSCQASGSSIKQTGPAGVAIALQTNGQIIVGGNFTNLNGTAVTNIARVDSTGTIDPTFKASVVGPATNFPYFPAAPVTSIVLQSDGKAVICGDFINVNGVARTNLARLNTDGTLDDSFQGYVGTTNPSTNGLVNVCIESSGKLLLSGSFTNVNGVARYHLARLNAADGSLEADVWNGGSGDDVNPNVGMPGITGIGQPDGKIFLFGNFHNINGVERRGLARLNTDGSVDDTFQNGMIGNPSQNRSAGYVSGAVIQSDAKILIIGFLTDINGYSAKGIARLWGNQPTCVESTSMQPDGNIILTVRATPGVTNRLQFKNAVADANWTDLPVDIVGTDPSTTTNVIDTPDASGVRFYQFKQLP